MDEVTTCQDGRMWPIGHGCVKQILAPVPDNTGRLIGICDQCGAWLESRYGASYTGQVWYAFGPIVSTADADRLMGTP